MILPTEYTQNRKSCNTIRVFSVAVVRPTIGRTELERTIQSVQTYPLNKEMHMDTNCHMFTRK